jgi:phospholipase/carboxylesterase
MSTTAPKIELHRAGAPIESARGAVILVHGRGGSAADFLSVARLLDQPDLAYLAPQAPGYTWYPQSFLAPIAANEPGISRGIATLNTIVEDLLSRGIDSRKIAVLGFSQGACLTSEFAARHPRRYGAILALTGGLIGPPGTPRDYPGSLDGTPVFLGASDPDPHVPWSRVQESSGVLSKMGATVTLQRYASEPHTILQEQIEVAREWLGKL